MMMVLLLFFEGYFFLILKMKRRHHEDNVDEVVVLQVVQISSCSGLEVEGIYRLSRTHIADILDVLLLQFSSSCWAIHALVGR